jgi:hypothetical protein
VNFTTCVDVPALRTALGALNANVPAVDAEPPLRIDADNG